MTENPKHLLITGASSGIGAALAVHYAAPGVRLALSGRDRKRLDSIAAQCGRRGAEVAAAAVDVTDRTAMKAWIEKEDSAVPLDLVIANAGVSGGTGGVLKGEPSAQVRHIFDINVYGVFNTVEPVLPRMIARGRGQIALMSSLASFSGWPGAPAYSASKGAVRLYGEALHAGMAAHGVRINVVCPGFIKTPMTAVNDYAMPFMMEADKAAQVIARGLAMNRVRIAFPWQTYLLAGFLGILPPRLALSFMRRLPEKPAGDT